MLELLNPIDQEQFKKDFLSAEPFPHFCIDNFLKEDFANELYEQFPSFTEAQKMGKEFSGVNEKKKVQITDSSLFPPAFTKLNNLLASPEFLAMWENFTEIPDLLADKELKGGGIHETNSGGHLDVHVDFNYVEQEQLHRRLNILIYFNKDWKEEYGGYLDVWDKDVKQRHGYFAPVFNRACGFMTSESSFHGVTPVTCPPSIMRKSFAVYYYTKQAPAGWDGVKHSTVFKPRPDEWVKGNVLMPYEKLKKTPGKIKRKIKSMISK